LPLFPSILVSCEDKNDNGSSVFPQGIGSGDPKPNGIVLWTRVNPEIFDNHQITVEISEDSSFRDILISKTEYINLQENFTVKSYITSSKLNPWQKYYYRFRYKNHLSSIGMFKTLPEKNQEIEKVRFGVLNCQDYSVGNFYAHRYLAQEDLDFVLFLGDYIYEYSFDKEADKVLRKLNLPSGNEIASALEDYYYLYNTYKSDMYLQELHRKFPFLVVWDDHEYANDCYGYNAPDHFIKDEEYLKNLRTAASKAWFYSMPVDVQVESFDKIKIYREFCFGDLMKIILTDERSYRSSHPCGERKFQRYLSQGCGEEKSPDRTMLGEEQLNWFFYQLSSNEQRWTVWANPVAFMKLKLDNRYISFDSWDGYQYERDLILQKIKQIQLKNLFILTGDLHSFVGGFAQLDEENIVPEFITTSATSSNLDEIVPIDVDLLESLVSLENEHIKYFNSSTNGYTIVEMTKDYTDIIFKSVDIQNADKGIKIKRNFRLYLNNTKFIEY